MAKRTAHTKSAEDTVGGRGMDRFSVVANRLSASSGVRSWLQPCSSDLLIKQASLPPPPPGRAILGAPVLVNEPDEQGMNTSG